MNLEGWAAIAGVAVSLLAAVGMIANNRRTADLQAQAAKAASKSTDASDRAEAQRVALEGLRELVDQLQEELRTVRGDLAARRAREADLLESIGQLQLRHQEALQRLEEANVEWDRCRRQLEEHVRASHAQQ